ncbi:MAG TPA: GNAT family N-acetyltransferase [Geminicoccus sp.]|jgi:ribosomal-protein-alanine N-acetyltransferase|uniref:GNAT family N-acetyltransferase n=1 Tax=Geminicoccus sp. TaxID=2024832 RepID=UPI002E37E10B|nr:GNAT family N-acetyltransferase [Geminicoccus sp.]HEX2525196.1 GNAT family N-acetyltransferase [Geminicoccus sp.]
MSEATSLRTKRLVMRPWREADRRGFRMLNADPEVMRYFPRPLSAERSDSIMEAWQDHIDRHGWGFWAVEQASDGAFVGAVGIANATFPAPFTPAVEIGWRLSRAYWHKGYAQEAASEAMRYGFDELQVDEIVAFTLPTNLPSRRVMERLGMRHDPADDFEHPSVEAGHPMRHHVLYRLARVDWRATAGRR